MRQSVPPLTAGQLAERAERRLRLIIGGGLVLLGCHSTLTPKQQHADTVFACRVASLAPYVGKAVDVEETVRQTALGKASPLQLMNVLGVAKADIYAALDAWNKCDPELEAPTPEAGDKVL